MMVLRRKIGEAIRIGTDIKISVQEVQDGRVVRFGIEAPAEVAIHRQEIYELIQAENRAASGGDAWTWLNGDGTAGIKMSGQSEQVAEPFLFSQGIAGFPGAKHFSLIGEGRGNMVCMQSVETPEAVFILIPWEDGRLGEPPLLNQEQQRCLDLDSESDLIWMVVLNPFADSEWVTANLKAPVVLSQSSRRGLQLIRSESEHDLRFHWMPQPE